LPLLISARHQNIRASGWNDAILSCKHGWVQGIMSGTRLEAVPARASLSEDGMPNLSLETFASVVRESFDLSIGETSMPLTLVEVQPLPVNPFPGMLRAPFSLLFRNASQVVLPQKLYGLKNASLGRLDLFLVPIARDHEGVIYQAVFN
jgi:hypothetical protein